MLLIHVLCIGKLAEGVCGRNMIYVCVLQQHKDLSDLEHTGIAKASLITMWSTLTMRGCGTQVAIHAASTKRRNRENESLVRASWSSSLCEKRTAAWNLDNAKQP